MKVLKDYRPFESWDSIPDNTFESDDDSPFNHKGGDYYLGDVDPGFIGLPFGRHQEINPLKKIEEINNKILKDKPSECVQVDGKVVLKNWPGYSTASGCFHKKGLMSAVFCHDQPATSDDYPLHQAAGRGDLQRLKKMDLSVKQLNSRDKEGRSPLHIAAAYGQNAIVKLLLEGGACPNLVDLLLNSPLHLSARHGKTEIAKILIESGAWIEFRNASGHTALHFAALSGNAGLVDYLILKGLKIDTPDRGGSVPLHYAATTSSVDVIMKLHTNKLMHRKDRKNYSPAKIAAIKGHYDVLKRLLQQDDPNHKISKTVFSVAASHGHIPIAKLCMSLGIGELFQNETTPLHAAARKKQYRMVQWLMENGAPLNSLDEQGETPLKVGAQSSDNSHQDKQLLRPWYRAHLSELKSDLIKYKRNNKDLTTKKQHSLAQIFAECFVGVCEQTNFIEFVQLLDKILISQKGNQLQLIRSYPSTVRAQAITDMLAEINLKEMMGRPGSQIERKWSLRYYFGKIDSSTSFEDIQRRWCEELKEISEKTWTDIYYDSPPFENIFDLQHSPYQDDKFVDLLDVNFGGQNNNPFDLESNHHNRKFSEDRMDIDSGAHNTSFSFGSSHHSSHSSSNSLESASNHRQPFNFFGQGDSHEVERDIPSNSDNFSFSVFNQTPNIQTNTGFSFGTKKKTSHPFASSSKSSGQDLIGCNKLTETPHVLFDSYLGLTPVHIAAKNGQINDLKNMKLNKVSLSRQDAKGNTPLHAASENGHPETIAFLVSKCAEIEAKNHCGETPLLHATRAGRLGCVKRLIQLGATTNILNVRGQSPLHLAAMSGNSDLIKYLIDQGSDTKCRDNGKSTPLHYAAFTGYFNSVKLLASKDVINIKNCEGSTPLHYAAKTKCIETSQLLVDLGASRIARDIFHKRPIDIYEENNDRISLHDYLFLILSPTCEESSNDSDVWPL